MQRSGDHDIEGCQDALTRCAAYDAERSIHKDAT